MMKLHEEAVTGFDKMHKFCIGLRDLFFNAEGTEVSAEVRRGFEEYPQNSSV